MAVQNNVKHEKKRFNIMLGIIIVLLLLLLIIGVVIIIFLQQNQTQEDTDAKSSVKGTIITQDNAEELDLEEGAVPDGYYNVSMSLDWHFKDGVTEDARIANKETNERTVYFDLLTEETEEVVYSSPYIPVGESMQGFALDKEMDPGTYDMIVRYYLVDDDNVEVSNVSVGITIYVE